MCETSVEICLRGSPVTITAARGLLLYLALAICFRWRASALSSFDGLVRVQVVCQRICNTLTIGNLPFSLLFEQQLLLCCLPRACASVCASSA